MSKRINNKRHVPRRYKKDRHPTRMCGEREGRRPPNPTPEVRKVFDKIDQFAGDIRRKHKKSRRRWPFLGVPRG